MSRKVNLSVPWWTTIILWLSLVFLSVLLAALPYFSMPVFVTGIVVATISSVPAAVLILFKIKNWWIGVVTLLGMAFYPWGFAIRNFALITPGREIWISLIILSFLVALLLPAFAPAASKLLWREQTEPQTVFGKKLFNILLLIAPVAGTLGASVRFIKVNANGYPISFFIFGVLSWFIATLMTFAFWYQAWQIRPWKNKKIGRRK